MERTSERWSRAQAEVESWNQELDGEGAQFMLEGRIEDAHGDLQLKLSASRRERAAMLPR